MMSFVKSLFLFCSIFIYSSNHAQPFKHPLRPPLQPWIKDTSGHKLIAANDKHSRRYYEGDVLKICFHQNGEIVKAKGRLLVDSVGAVEINPYGRKPIVLIAADSIVSIGRWHHAGKIVSASLAGAGLIFTGLGLATAPTAPEWALILFYSPAVVFGTGFIVTTSVVFISEWASLRSQKQGYHFHVE